MKTFLVTTDDNWKETTEVVAEWYTWGDNTVDFYNTPPPTPTSRPFNYYNKCATFNTRHVVSIVREDGRPTTHSD